MKIKKIFFLFMAFIFLLGAILFFYLSFKEYDEGAASNEVDYAAQETYIKTEDSTTDSIAAADTESEAESDPNMVNKVDWDSLLADYPNVKAWITIPGTRIDYPISQGTDNDYYLTHNYKNESDFLGGIFMDYRQSSDFSDFNTFIYGHNINVANGSPKFGELIYYYDETFFNEHTTIYIYTPTKVYKGTVFAVHADSAETDSYNVDIDSLEELHSYAEFMKSESVIPSDFDTSTITKMMTLWACRNRQITNSNGEYVPEDKSRTFLSVALSE